MYNIDEIYRTIYNRYTPILRLIARKKSIPHCDIDDIIQDAFLSFYTHYPITWPEYRIRSALVRITYNLCEDYFRHQNSNPQIYLESAILFGEELLCSRSEEDPLSLMLKYQAMKDILEIFKTMKKEWGIVLYLYAIQDRSITEISQMLGISESACRMRLTRGRQYLHKQSAKNSDGMTLVEVITVMTILTVITAATIPSLRGFISKTRERQYIIEAYSVKSSAQMFVTEHYADGTLDDHKVMLKMLE